VGLIEEEEGVALFGGADEAVVAEVFDGEGGGRGAEAVECGSRGGAGGIGGSEVGLVGRGVLGFVGDGLWGGAVCGCGWDEGFGHKG